MQCKACRCEMKITASRTVVEGDTSPDTPTKVYTEQDLCCRNAACPEFNKVQQTVRVQIY